MTDVKNFIVLGIVAVVVVGGCCCCIVLAYCVLKRKRGGQTEMTMGDQQSAQGNGLATAGAQPTQNYEPPYPGPCAEYKFVNVEVMMSEHFSLGHSSMVTSNIDAYYHVLAQTMDQGFRLLSFYHIPGQERKKFLSRDTLMPFQGIFCRYPSVQTNERFQLKIEKSQISPKLHFNGLISPTSTVTDVQHLFQTIANNTINGGRLVCIELTGQEQQTRGIGIQHRMPTLGCDLFFEIPVGQRENYVYNIVSAPMAVVPVFSFKSDCKVVCDWDGILGANLNQGWRLVEIFMDEAEYKNGVFSRTDNLNTQWFFEKPSSQAHISAPRYQGTVVEHWIETKKSGFYDTTTVTNWEPLIQDMGNKGWELACILETPEEARSGFTAQVMKCLLFFQRPLINTDP